MRRSRNRNERSMRRSNTMSRSRSRNTNRNERSMHRSRNTNRNERSMHHSNSRKGSSLKRKSTLLELRTVINKLLVKMSMQIKIRDINKLASCKLYAALMLPITNRPFIIDDCSKPFFNINKQSIEYITDNNDIYIKDATRFVEFFFDGNQLSNLGNKIKNNSVPQPIEFVPYYFAYDARSYYEASNLNLGLQEKIPFMVITCIHIPGIYSPYHVFWGVLCDDYIIITSSWGADMDIKGSDDSITIINNFPRSNTFLKSEYVPEMLGFINNINQPATASKYFSLNDKEMKHVSMNQYTELDEKGLSIFHIQMRI